MKDWSFSLRDIHPHYSYATSYRTSWASQVALVVKNPPANAGDIRDMGSTPGSGRWHGNPLQCSCLEKPIDRGAWWATAVASERAGHDWSELARTGCSSQCSKARKRNKSHPDWKGGNKIVPICRPQRTLRTKKWVCESLRRQSQEPEINYIFTH